MKLSFFVPGTPKAQPRTQATAYNPKGGGKAKARVFDPGTADAWKALVKQYANLASEQALAKAIPMALEE